MSLNTCPVCKFEFADDKEVFSYEILWELIQSGLSKHAFMSLEEYNSKCSSGKILKKDDFEDDLAFYRSNPLHPMASENRFIRIESGDAFRKFVIRGKGKLYITDRMIDFIHIHLFDCCASVRQSLIIGLIVLGNERSYPFFEKLILIEESKSNKDMMQYSLDDKKSGRNEPLKNPWLFGL